MTEDSRRVLQSLWRSARGKPRELVWEPRADIYRTGWGWLIKFDLAGVRPEDLRVTIANDVLTVEGARRDVLVEEACTCYSLEISYSQFRRTLKLPGILANNCRVEREYRDGMLIIRCRSPQP